MPSRARIARDNAEVRFLHTGTAAEHLNALSIFDAAEYVGGGASDGVAAVKGMVWPCSRPSTLA